VTGRPSYTDDELREQWAFLDALVEHQAAALRASPPEPEEEVTLEGRSPASTAVLRELEAMRSRVRLLEDERRELIERLRVADSRLAAAQRAALQRQESAAVRIWRRFRG
jgi:Tfp pilus assembly protein FimV